MSVENTQKSLAGDVVARPEKEFDVDEKQTGHDFDTGDIIDTAGKPSRPWSSKCVLLF